MLTISVVIPTYKSRVGLVNSIESALLQDYRGLIEVIVVDDNEPNSEERKNTMTLMQRYSNNSKVVYICHEHNKNGAAARNTGIKVSKGDLIAFLDDDDLFLQGKLRKQVDYLEAHPEYDAVYCLARRMRFGCPMNVIEGDGTRSILTLTSNFYTPTLMFRRESLKALKGFDETFRRHQDYELLLRFFAAGYKIGCVPEVLTEIGLNQGENVPTGKNADELKTYFFSKFNSFIKKEDDKTPGFANRVYAIHYANVFLNHIKTKHYLLALKILSKYYFCSPLVFNKVIISRMKICLLK